MASRLKALFRDVEPVEITAMKLLEGKSPHEIAQLLPRFTTLQEQGEHPAFGILTDVATGRVYAIRSGYLPHEVTEIKGVRYKTGTMTRATARAPGDVWDRLGAHVEGQAAAFMHKESLGEAVLVMNAATPCKGRNQDGCLFSLPFMLHAGARLTVYNKYGKPFLFVGVSVPTPEEPS